MKGVLLDGVACTVRTQQTVRTVYVVLAYRPQVLSRIAVEETPWGTGGECSGRHPDVTLEHTGEHVDLGDREGRRRSRRDEGKES